MKLKIVSEPFDVPGWDRTMAMVFKCSKGYIALSAAWSENDPKDHESAIKNFPDSIKPTIKEARESLVSEMVARQMEIEE